MHSTPTCHVCPYQTSFPLPKVKSHYTTRGQTSVEAMQGVMTAVKREDTRLTLWLSSKGRPVMCFTWGPGLSTTLSSSLLYPVNTHTNRHFEYSAGSVQMLFSLHLSVCLSVSLCHGFFLCSSVYYSQYNFVHACLPAEIVRKLFVHKT